MTTHPEDAMTRERILEEALRATAKRACWACADGVPFWDDRDGLDRKGLYHDRSGPYGGLFKCLAPEARTAIRALTSAQQEPAPAADAEQVAKELAAKLFIEATVDDAAFDCDLATPIIAAALRRYAGDGGVTDEMVEAANREYWKNRQGPKMSEDRKQFEHDKMRAALEAAARVKSGEKGGAR